MDMVNTYMVLEEWILLLGGDMSRNSMDLFEIMEEILKFKDELISIKEDMLKMIDAIEKNDMHIKQLNWKLNNRKELSNGSTSVHIK